MLTRLQGIAAQEGLEVHAGALDLIARQSTGSMRDAESLLDQLSSFGEQEITLEQVQTMLGTVSSQAVKDLVDDLAARDVASGLGRIGRTISDGADPRQLNQEVLEYLRGLLLIKTTNLGLSYITPEQQVEMVEQAKKFDLDRLVATIKLFSQAASDLKATTQPQLPMELAFVEATLRCESDTASRRTASSSPEGKPSIPSSEETAVTVSEPRRASSAPAPLSDDRPRPNAMREGRASLGTEGNDPPLTRLQNNWTDILASIKGRNRHVEAIIRDCPPTTMDGDVISLTAASPFHKEKLEDDKAKRLVEDVISETMGHLCRIKCILPREGRKRRAPSQNDDLKAIADDYMIKAGLELGGKIGGVQLAGPSPHEQPARRFHTDHRALPADGHEKE
jgi:DNA polymerase-3 subunit gamma/tau